MLAGRRNGFLPLLTVDYFYALQDDWQPPADGSAKVIARLRNNAPLVIEKKFGKGRVIAQLTKLSSAETPLGRWTNWSLNPAFPVLANELVSYLAISHDADPLLNIGDDLVISAEEGKYEPRFRFVPTRQAIRWRKCRPQILHQATRRRFRANRESHPLRARSRHRSNSRKPSTDSQARKSLAKRIYEVQLQPTNGPLERREFAVNVPTGEGDLALTSPPDLTRQLAGVDYQIHNASDMALDSQQLAGFQMGDALLVGLIVLLLTRATAGLPGELPHQTFAEFKK